MSFDPQDPRVTAYVFDELGPAERSAFEAELADSIELQETVEATRSVVRQLSGEMAHEPPRSLSAAQRTAVSEAISHSAKMDDAPEVNLAAKPAGGSRRLAGLLALAAIAASLLVVVGLTQFWPNGFLDNSNANRDIAQRPVAESAQDRWTAADPVELPDVGANEVYGDGDMSSPFASGVRGPDSRRIEELTHQVEETTRMQPLAEDNSAAAEERKRLVTGEAVTNSAAAYRQLDTTPGSTRYKSDQSSAPAGQPGSGGGYAGGSAPVINAGVAATPLSRLSGRRSSAPAADEMSSAPAAGDPYGGGAPHGAAYGNSSSASGGSEMYGYDSGMMGGGMAAPGMGAPGYARGEGMGTDAGSGPGWAGDRHTPIEENPFKAVKDQPLSTFSIDVDTASYSKVRMYLLQHGQLPRPDAVRIEELVNYFIYDYQPPQDDVPFAAHVAVAECPWQPAHRLVRFGIKGREIEADSRPTSNLVFLLDVSGSMNRDNKLPLVKRGMKMLIDQLGENDRVAIVVYAGAAGMVLDSTTGDQKSVIVNSLDRLHAGGSTNGGEGVLLAYQLALDNFVEGGVNRVILCTDGDFNVGVTGTDQLVKIAEDNAKTGVFLSVLGFGMGNHNDAMLEQLSNKGNGNYAFIDSETEARKVLVEQMSGTLVTIAKDVKIQVEFNPNAVQAYRLIGYENRLLAAEDFNDDTKDAGEIGAGHTVTALYEVVPAGAETPVSPPPVDDLRYQRGSKLTKAADSGEMLTLKIRYKQPDEDKSALLTFPVEDRGERFGQADKDFRFAASVAAFGMLLRNSQHCGEIGWAAVEEIATEAASGDETGYRYEFLQMIARARQLSGQ